MKKLSKDKIFGIVLACVLIGVVIFGVVFGVIRERNERGDDSASGITVVFVADGTEVSREDYPFESMDDVFAPEVPEVPQKVGYVGEWDWSSVEAGEAQITVNAKYTAIKYTVTFVADGNVVETLPLSAEAHEGIPAVPAKEGSEGRWVYILTGENTVTATAVYY